MARAWYSYNGTGNVLVSASYNRISGDPGCSGSKTICAIYSLNGGLKPVSPLSGNIQQYINDALAFGLPQPQMPIDTPLFVDLKD